MQPAFEHACGTKTPSADIFIFRANLPYVLCFKKFKKVRSRSVHNFGTCKKHSTAQCRDEFCGQTRSKFLIRSRHRAAPFKVLRLFACTEIVQRPRPHSPSIIWNKNIWQIRTKNKMPELGVCFPLPCSSAGRMFTATTSRVGYYGLIDELVRFLKN